MRRIEKEPEPHSMDYDAWAPCLHAGQVLLGIDAGEQTEEARAWASAS